MLTALGEAMLTAIPATWQTSSQAKLQEQWLNSTKQKGKWDEYNKDSIFI